MKGIALETIGFMLIGLFGVFLLIMFVSGSLGDLTRNVFCYFYQKVFSKDTEMCESIETTPKQAVIKTRSSEELARWIAVYSIDCWEKATKSLKTKDTNCYSLSIEGGPFAPPVSEETVTDILLNEGGCGKLQNSDINNDCGEKDQLGWEVSENIITTQKLILIKYDDTDKQIVVRG